MAATSHTPSQQLQPPPQPPQPPRTPSPTDIACVEGRKPWYDEKGAPREPLFIGVSGCSCAGKSQLCKAIVTALHMEWVVVVRLDAFYKPLTDAPSDVLGTVNFDCPEAFDFAAAKAFLETLRQGRRSEIPVYDPRTYAPAPANKVVYGVDVVIFEGLLATYDPSIESMMDIKLFVEADEDLRLARRLKRDVSERGRNVADVLRQYERFVKPGAERYVLPLKKRADIVVPGGRDAAVQNKVVVDLIAQRAHRILSDRGWVPVLPALDSDALPPNVHTLPATPMIRAMQTIIRDKQTSHDDFIFYSDRLCSLLVENALSLLPYEEHMVTTPTGSQYRGEQFKVGLCGVSIMRSGSSMEAPLRRIAKGIRIGKILIQSDGMKRPELLYVKLPKVIAGRHVLLMDPMLTSGATATMAIHVLLDHGVKQKEIHFVTHIASLQGVHAVARKFPEITITAGLIDKTDLTDRGYLACGLGYQPERYFW